MDPAPRPEEPAAPEAALSRAARLVLPAGERLLLGVSGGSDSVALLAAAAAVLPGRCAALWIDHGLRPGVAREGELVERLGARLGVPVRRCAAPPAPTEPRGETAARRRRLAALAAEARAGGFRVVALAHHGDDLLETTLLNLLRGHRGDRALAGIPAVRPFDGELLLLRPFLCGSPPGRAALARYREAAGLPHVDDPTNADLRIPRNAVRALLAADDARELAERVARAGRRAVRRLEARLLHLVGRLPAALAAEGLGCRLDHAAWVPRPGDDPLAHTTELLRLLGAALSPARRIDVRRSTQLRLATLVAAGSGAALLPTDRGPLHVRASRNALHLPDARLHAAGPLEWLARTPLFLTCGV